MIGWIVLAQLVVVAHAPATTTACAPFELTAAARVPGDVAPRIAPPATSRLELLASSVSSRREPDGAGRPFSITEATFQVATRAIGRVQLPGIAAVAGALRAQSVAAQIEVAPAAADEDDPVVQVRAYLEGAAAPGRDRRYVGEQVDYVVDVRLNGAARRRLRRNPTFFPPEMSSVLAYDIAAPSSERPAAAACFEHLTYHRALFPLYAGRTTIAPAVLTYALPVSPSFFSREESHEARTDSVSLETEEPPRAGRPAAYDGAVGTFRLSSHVDASHGRMGDPLVFTVRVEGVGNIKLLPRPALRLDWASVVPGPERVSVDTSRPLVRGVKQFEWLVTPRRAGAQEIPSIRYPYFDPYTERYDSARTEPMALDIASASLASAEPADVAPRLPIRTRLRAAVPPPLPDRPGYWLLLALAPVPATLRRIRRVRRRVEAGETAARRLERAAAIGTPLAARELRRRFLDAIRERLPALGPATARHTLSRQLRLAGVTAVTADAAEQLLDRLDDAAFGGGEDIDAASLAHAARLAAAIDAEAAPSAPAARTVPAARSSLVLALLTSLAAGAQALTPQLEVQFAEGVRAYLAGDAAGAERQFARIVARAPRVVDAWANVGTSAWVRGDTARAAVAWQRALRLDPLDTDVRARLDSIPTLDGPGARGLVPPVPVNLLAGTAWAAWMAAWLALALRPARWKAAARRVAGGAVAIAVVLLAGVLELRARMDPRGLGVVRRAVALREGPLATAPAGATVSVGSVGQLGAREGSWVRIVLDGSHAGWVPVALVLPLDDSAVD